MTSQTFGRTRRIGAVVLYGSFTLYATESLTVRDWGSWPREAFTGGSTRFVVPVLVALMALGPLLLLLSWQRLRRAAPYAIGFTLLLCAIAFAGVLAHVENARQQATELLITGAMHGASEASALLSEALGRAETTQLLTSVATFLLPPGLFAIAGELWERREQEAGRDTPIPAIVSASVGLLLCMTAVGSFMCLRWQWPHSSGDWSQEERAAYFLEAFTWLSETRIAIVILATVATVAILRAAWRTGQHQGMLPHGVLPVGLGCFVVGGLFWLLTRPLAHDAAHPAPGWAAHEFPALKVALPERNSCAPLRDTPMVEFAAGHARIDGMVAGGPADLRGILKSKADLWKATIGGQRRHFPGIVSFAASSSTPMGDLRPFLDAALSAGYPEVDAWVAHAPRSFVTRTRGTLTESQPFCRVILRLDVPLPTADIWGRLVDQLETPPNRASFQPP